MPAEFYENPDVKSLAETLYPELGWGDQPRIKFLTMVADKSEYLGKCSKATGKWKYLSNLDYVIEVWETFWASASENDRKALLWHELSHVEEFVKEDGSIIWKIKKHDVEEFHSTVMRYGLWNQSLRDLKGAFEAGDNENN